jgi:HAD superfamily phosphatase
VTIALIFDMDGVLVDVSHSYRKAVQETVAAFLGKSIAEKMILEYKNRSGFNNDWDLTERILLDHKCQVDKKTIIRVFQDLYLGTNYSGLIRNEIWLMEKKLLSEISRNYPCGIVTGRPRDEAEYVIKRFKMESFFPVVITMDHLPEDRQKPHPMGIQMALKKLNCTQGFYFGDTVDDMLAAKAAGMIAIGVIPPGVDQDSHKRNLLQQGAAGALDSINHLMEVLS